MLDRAETLAASVLLFHGWSGFLIRQISKSHTGRLAQVYSWAWVSVQRETYKTINIIIIIIEGYRQLTSLWRSLTSEKVKDDFISRLNIVNIYSVEGKCQESHTDHDVMQSKSILALKEMAFKGTILNVLALKIKAALTTCALPVSL